MSAIEFDGAVVNVPDVIDHRESIVATERSVILDNFEELDTLARKLANTKNILKGVESGLALKASRSLPAPGLKLFWSALEDSAGSLSESLESESLKFVSKLSSYLWPEKFYTEGTAEARLGLKRANACPASEIRFNDSRLQLLSSRPASGVAQERINVLHDSDGRILAIEKYLAPSAMTLVPLRFTSSQYKSQLETDVFMPSGTIGSTGETAREETSILRDANKNKIVTYLVKGPLVFRPIRIGPWAFTDPMDRMTFSIEEHQRGKPLFDLMRAKLLAEVKLGDYTEAAEGLIPNYYA